MFNQQVIKTRWLCIKGCYTALQKLEPLAVSKHASIQLLDEMSKKGEITGKKLEEKRKEIDQYVKKMEGYGHNIPVGW